MNGSIVSYFVFFFFFFFQGEDGIRDYKETGVQTCAFRSVRVLRKAAALAPGDSKTQLHLARALADAGQTAESKAAMDRFRQLGPVVSKAVPGGLVDYLSLTDRKSTRLNSSHLV